MRTLCTVLALTLGLAATATADAKPKTTTSTKKEKPVTLNAGLKPLESMLGEWDCAETYHAGGFTPQELTARGTDVLRVGPGGNAVIADYKSTSPELGVYTAHDMITWDDANQQFRYLFIDSFGPAVQLHAGKAVGSTFVFEGAFTFGQKAGTLRRTYRDITATSQTLEATFIDDKGSVTKLVTIQKTKKK